MKSFDETKKELLEKYPKYFEVLDIDFQARCLMYLPDADYKKELDKNLRCKIDGEKILAENKGLRDHEFNKFVYETHLKIYKEIVGDNDEK